jgi:hypothetical protein
VRLEAGLLGFPSIFFLTVSRERSQARPGKIGDGAETASGFVSVD